MKPESIEMKIIRLVDEAYELGFEIKEMPLNNKIAFELYKSLGAKQQYKNNSVTILGSHGPIKLTSNIFYSEEKEVK